MHVGAVSGRPALAAAVRIGSRAVLFTHTVNNPALDGTPPGRSTFEGPLCIPGMHKVALDAVASRGIDRAGGGSVRADRPLPESPGYLLTRIEPRMYGWMRQK